MCQPYHVMWLERTRGRRPGALHSLLLQTGSLIAGGVADNSVVSNRVVAPLSRERRRGAQNLRGRSPSPTAARAPTSPSNRAVSAASSPFIGRPDTPRILRLPGVNLVSRRSTARRERLAPRRRSRRAESTAPIDLRSIDVAATTTGVIHRSVLDAFRKAIARRSALSAAGPPSLSVSAAERGAQTPQAIAARADERARRLCARGVGSTNLLRRRARYLSIRRRVVVPTRPATSSHAAPRPPRSRPRRGRCATVPRLVEGRGRWEPVVEHVETRDARARSA